MKRRILLTLFSFLFSCSILFAQTSSWLWGNEATTTSSGVFNFSGQGEGWSMAADKDGNGYMTGFYYDTVYFGTYHFISPSLQAYVAKYDCNGNIVWAESSTSNPKSLKTNTRSNCVAVDDSENVYMTGFFNDTIYFGSVKLTNPFDSINDFAMFLVKYDKNGNVIWARQSVSVSNNSSAKGMGVTVGRDNNVYLTGNFSNSVSFGSKSVSAPGTSFFIAKYTTGGNMVWVTQPTKFYDSASILDGTYSITTDFNDNIYIGGTFKDSLVMGTTTLYFPLTPFSDVFLAKYDSGGNFTWARQANYEPLDDYPNLDAAAVVTDYAGNVYMCGHFCDTMSFGKFKLVSSYNSYPHSDMFFVKYTSIGNVVWAKSSTTSNYTQWGACQLGVDVNNNLYMSGIGYGDTMTYDSHTITTNYIDKSQMGNSFVLKTDSAGNYLCGSVFDVDDDDRNGIASDPSGNYVYWCSDLDDSTKIGAFSFPTYSGEMPVIARWNPCNSIKPIQFVNSIANYNCNTVTASVDVIPDCGGAFTVKWNTIPVQTGDTAKNLSAGTYIATIIALSTPDTLYDTIVVTAGSFKNPISVAPASPSICKGQGILLTANGLQTYQWSPSAGLNSTTGAAVVANPSVSTTYTVQGTNANGCSGDTTVAVVVNSSPTVSVDSATSCSGIPVTLIASGAQSYAWYPDYDLNTGSGSTVVATVTATIVYMVVGTSSNGCADTAYSLLKIFQGPNQPTIFQSHDTLFSSATTENQWYRNDTLLKGATGQFLVIANSTAKYTVVVTDPANGCSNTSDSLITSGIEQIASLNNKISIYPNPATNQLIITSSQDNESIQKIVITDLPGQVIFKSSPEGLGLKKQVIGVNSLTDGLYFITITTDTGVVTRKFVVSR